MHKLSARNVALMAVFAALSAIVCKVVPGIPIIGATHSTISFDVTLAPIYGVIIGPYLGFFAALIGGLAVASSPFTIITSFGTGISAFVAGMLTTKKVNGELGGWVIAALVLGILNLSWYSTWVGREAPYYPVLHIGGLLIVLVVRGWIADKTEKGERETNLPTKRQLNPPYVGWGILFIVFGIVCYFVYLDLAKIVEALNILSVLSFLAYSLLIVGCFSAIYGLFSWIRVGFVTAVALACYCGIIADHMVGNLAFIGLAETMAPGTYLPRLFMVVLPISIGERALFTAIATVIGVSLILSLRRAGLIFRKTQ